MSTLLATLCALSVETLLGWAACAAALDREQRAVLRALRGPATLALVVAPVATGLGWLAGSDPRWLLEPVRAIVPGAFTAAGSVAATGLGLVLHAGTLEGRGEEDRGRALARGGGKAMFLGSDLLVALTLASLIDASGPSQSALAHGGLPGAAAFFFGLAGCALGGFAGLLAGISGKPRPSGTVAAALYAGGLFVLISAVAPR